MLERPRQQPKGAWISPGRVTSSLKPAIATIDRLTNGVALLLFASPALAGKLH